MRLILCFLAVVLNSVCNADNTVGVQQTELATRKEIAVLMDRYRAVGLAVAVVRDAKLVYCDSFGFRDLEAKTPLEDGDLFRIASISKSFSATSVMQLVETEKLSLDSDVSDLIGFRVRNPKFPDDAITVKMLLAHTSGLNDSEGYFRLDVVDPAKNSSSSKCYNDYQPGTKYQYCNLNYNLIGTIIERVSGERFDQYVHHHLLNPLGLTGGFAVDALDASRFVTLYEYDVDKQAFKPTPTAYHARREEIQNYVSGYSTPIFSPAGGMKMSARDLTRYMSMHIGMGEVDGTRIIRRESAEMMQSIVSQQGRYGLAIATTDQLIPGKTLKGHTGSAYGLYSMMFFSPEEKFGLVLITNGCDPKRSEGHIEFLKLSARSLYEQWIK